jgi:hypothetical protein
VVEVGSAEGRVKDAGCVALENAGVGLDGDREGLNGEGGLHRGDVVGRNVGVASGEGSGVGL